MKTKSITILFIMIVSLNQAWAQQVTIPETISLYNAQEIALKNNPDLRVKLIETRISSKKVEQAQWKKIPDIYAGYGLRRNLIIPTTPVPAKAFNPGAPEGALMPLKFSTAWTSNATLNVKVDLFNPDQYGQVEEARQQVAISEMDFKISGNNLQYTIGKDYGACIIAKGQLKLAIEDTLSKTSVLKMAEDQYDAGRIKITDINQIEADKNTTLNNYFQAQKILASAKAQLLADMGYNPSGNYSFSFADSLQSLLSLFRKKDSNDTASLSLQKWDQQKRLTDIQLQYTRAGFLPTVSLQGLLGTNYYDNNFGVFNSDHWYGNSYVGLSVKLPITGELDRVNQIGQLHLQQQVDEANYMAQQNKNQLEKTQAHQDVIYTSKALLRQKKNMELADQNLQTAKEQFSEGRLLAGDLAKNDFLFQQAKTAWLQAAYDFIVAKMDLQKTSVE